MLDRERLIAAVFAQPEEDGLDGLSMRPLASRLGVQAPALYWHVGDKAGLLGLMARGIYATAYASVPTSTAWRAWLLGFGRALLAAFAAHLCATARAPGAPLVADQAQQISAPLLTLGLDQRQTLSFQASVISFALGWASFEANGPMHDYLDEMLDFDASFTAGLHALVRGFEI